MTIAIGRSGNIGDSLILLRQGWNNSLVYYVCIAVLTDNGRVPSLSYFPLPG